MRRSIPLLSLLLFAVGCEMSPQASAPQSLETNFNKVMGPESDTETLTAQLFSVLQRYAYTAEGAELAPYFKREVNSNIGVESLSILSADEGIKCDKITNLSSIVYMCELALKREGLDHSTNEKSIPAILYKALANVRGNSAKVLTDNAGNSIGCTIDATYGYGCQMILPGAVDKSASNQPERPRLPQEVPADEPSDIPVFQ